MSNEPEAKQEPPQVIIIDTAKQVRILIQAAEFASMTSRYDRRKPNETLLYTNDGKDFLPPSPTLAEYLFRAEKKIVKDMNPEIIQEALRMINKDLTEIKELLK